MVTVGAVDVVDDVGPAAWLTETVRRFAYNVESLLPDTFAAYARVFHPAHHGAKQVRWDQIARVNGKVAHPLMQFTRLIGYPSRYEKAYCAAQPGLFDEAPEVGSLPAGTAALLAEVLARHTTTADRCWFAVWWGFADLDPAFDERPIFSLPQREYWLARGPLSAAAQSLGFLGHSHRSANLWWPDDHAWCVATDIDLDSTYVGASAACVEELLASRELEVARLDVTAGVAADSDHLNAAPRRGPRGRGRTDTAPGST